MIAQPLGRIALLYDCTYPHVPGGGQKRLFEISRRLVAKGWQIDWYGLKSWPHVEPEVVDGILYVPVAPTTTMYRPDGKRAILQTLHFGRAIAKFPRIGRYDIVHMGQWPYFHFFPVRLFAYFGGASVSVDWWEVWDKHWTVYYGPKGLLGRVLERVCARIPQRTVAISETGLDQLKKIGVQSHNVEVIHNGLDFKAISNAVPAPLTSDIIYLGRLQPHKNVNLLLEAVALLAQRGHRLKISIIGDGSETAHLHQLAANRAISEQINWLGAIESDAEVHSLLRSSRLFVHPSTKEGGGSITSLEANAAGLPVVAFNAHNGISFELISEGVNGSWVGEFSAAALASGIERGLKLADEATCRSRCTDFAKSFDWDVIADQYDRMFQRMITGRSQIT